MSKSKIHRTLAAFSAILVFLILVDKIAFAQNSANILAGKDNTLYESSTGAFSNGAGEHFFAGRSGSGERRRGLLFFDIAGNVPAGATINSATLRLNMSRTISGSQLIGLHRVLSDWGEGASNAVGEEGTGANSTTGDATWQHRFFTTSFWTTVGGDFAATASASREVVSAVGVYTWGSTPQMVNDVQNWLNLPSSNFGWLLLGDESTITTAKRFDTRENRDMASRPLLTVNYTPTVAVKDNYIQPTAFALHENFPNPVTTSALNSATIIRYELPRNIKVNLVIYNLLGEKVRTLIDAPESAGFKQAIWDGANDAGARVAAGVYLYRLEAGAFATTRKLALIK